MRAKINYDETRLPKWAQAEFANLRRKLEEANDTIAEMRGALGESAVTADPYGRKIPIASNHKVRFRVGPADRQYVDVRIVRDADGIEGAEIMCGSGMLIEPNVTNVITVRVP